MKLLIATRLLAVSSPLLLPAPLARAAIITWDGGGADDNYATGANWVGNVAPPNNGTADLVFAGTTRLTPNLTWSGADLWVNSIAFANGAGAFVLTSNVAFEGNDLVIGPGGITNNDNSLQTITTGIAADQIVVSGAQTWNAASGALSFGTRISLAGDLLLSGAFAKTFSAGFLGNHEITLAAGTLNLTATTPSATTEFFVQTGSTLSVQADQATGSAFLTLNGGTIQTTVASQLNNDVFLGSGFTNTLGGAGRMDIAGFVRATGGAASVLNVTNSSGVSVGGGLQLFAGSSVTRIGAGSLFLSDFGPGVNEVNSIAGTLNLNAGETSFGAAVILSSGGILNVNGGATTVTSDSDLTIGDGASVNVNAGTFTLSSNSVGQVQTVTVDGGTLTSAAAGGFVLQDGLSGAGTSLVLKNGGQAMLAGSYIVPVNQTISVTGQGSLLSLGGDFQLQNNTTMNVSAGGDLTTGGRLVVGNGSNDTLLVDGIGSKLTIGSATATASVLGTGNKGTLTLSNFATGTIGNSFLVGNSPAGSNGELNVLAAAQLTVNADLAIGSFTTAGTTGTVDIDGVGAKLTVAGAGNVTTIGAASGGTGSLTVGDGASFVASSAAGGGTVLNHTGTITLNGGSADLGVLTRNGSGDIVFNGGALAFVGNLNVNAAGLLGSNVVLDATRSLTLTGTTTVDFETGLTVSGGALTTGSLFSNSNVNFTSGEVTVTSGALTIASFDGFSAPVLSVSGGAQLHLSGAGAVAGHLGTLLFNGGMIEAGGSPLTAGATGEIHYQGNTLIDGAVLGGAGLHRIGTGGARFNQGSLVAGSTLQQVAASTLTDFTIGGSLLSFAPLTLAGTTHVPGILNLNAGASTANGPLNITGSGGLNIFSGSTLTANAPVVASTGGGIAIMPGGSFTPVGGLTLDGGVLARANGGIFDPGAFTVTGGGHATFIGGFDYATAHTTTVTGIGSLFEVTSGDLFVDAGSTMNILAGARATATGRLVVSNVQSGVMLVDGAGSQLAAQGSTPDVSLVGSAATGTLTVRNGAAVTVGNEIYVGNFPAASHGTVSVQSGAQYTSHGDVRLANFTTAGIAGVIDVSGSGSAFTISGATSNLLAGAASGSTATINVGTGATFNASQAAGGGVTLNPTATLNVNGGTANLGPLTFAGGDINLNSGTLTYTGGLTVGAAGELGTNVTLSPGRHLAITGSTSVPAGQSLTVNGGTFSTSAVTVAGTAGVSGGGVLTTDSLNVNSSGVFTLGTGGTLNLPFGNITLTGAGAAAVFSGSTFNASVNSLHSQAGGNITYEGGARIFGGFLKGQGTHTVGALSGGPAGNVRFTGTTLANGATLQQANPARLTNFTGSGTINSSANLIWDGGALTSSGVLNVTSTVGASSFESNGVITISSGGNLTNSSSNLTLGGGSRTAVSSGGTLAALAGSNIQLNGGLLTNNGTVIGTLNVNYGSLAKGAGAFGTVNVTDGGRFSPGNSPGSASMDGMTFDLGSRYEFELNSTRAVPGIGSDLLNISGVLDFAGGTTPNSQVIIGVTTLDFDSQSAPLGDFDPAQSYQFLLANAAGGITGFTTGGIALDLSGFLNTYDGTFAVSSTGNQVYLNYAPVPEPSGIVLLLLGGLTATARRRRGKSARTPAGH